MRILRNVDLLVLALALPVWFALGLPILGWGAATVSWLAARWLQSFAEGRALAKGTRQAALGARAASLLGRLYLVTIAVFVAGLIDHKAGVSAGALAVVVFTAYFVSLFISHTFEEDAR
jgi:peptidoglycan/LPS O-acetylase OafA/YrhL